MDKNITVKISERRYDALAFILESKGTTLEKELDDALEQIFSKHVKGDLRNFVEKSEGKISAGGVQE
ncbi:hypothetical protein I5Q82_03260 [Acutalibacter muris]|jgi:hypothetical protein|uniref:Uncharacterized protein n=1 Tax=Acutalibacter muris TaxID=1796620 RepID=A0AA92LCC2_9FIRM|nr:hypothetical protein [Acutalibacter muris]QQR30734.1 hypothetical protein I5Q82_03260 [Acutalibacter muris]